MSAVRGWDGSYAQRAHEYERVYHKPERQADLRTLRDLVAASFEGKHVPESRLRRKVNWT
jgi:hypothetical protein